jgi:uncharacterized integral membrane protein
MLVASIIALMMEAANTSETSINFYQRTWRNLPETVIFLLAAMRTQT